MPPSKSNPVTASIAATLFGMYRYAISPILHGFGVSRCIYLPTCSEYAHIAILRHGWIKGSALAVARVARCNPLAHGGVDPVPE